MPRSACSPWRVRIHRRRVSREVGSSGVSAGSMIPTSVRPARRSRAASEMPAFPPPITATWWLMVLVMKDLSSRKVLWDELRLIGQACLDSVVEGIVDEHDVMSGAVEQARGDRGAIAAGAVHPQLAWGQRQSSWSSSSCSGNVCCAGDEAGGVFVVAADVEQHGIVVGRGSASTRTSGSSAKVRRG